jgi:methyltransferase (TIGR00027 family)
VADQTEENHERADGALMQQRDASRTALGTARLRAMHQMFDAQPLILDDPIAALLLDRSDSGPIDGIAERHRSAGVAALRSHVVLRSRFAEDRLAEAVSRGVTQYVILGAGFDTFALRQPAWADTLKVIEVDHPASQAAKLSRIAAAGLAVPDNVRFAGLDFERESLLDGLGRQGVSLTKPTFFSWLGVTMYLEKTAIDAVFRSAAAFPAGSEIVLTFLPTPASKDTSSSLARRVTRAGEPFLSSFSPEQIASMLCDAGFASVGFLSSIEAEERYYRHRPNDLPVPAQTGIACAVC